MTNPWGSRCWLLTSPRSGSTYLQYLLNYNAGVSLNLPEDRDDARCSFGEHLGNQHCRTWKEFVAWDPYVTKMQCHHFGAYLIDRFKIQQALPGIRFVLLERKDVYQQAVSLAISNRTGITQCNCEAEQQAFQSLSLTVTDGELVNCLRAVHDYQDFWRNWLHSCPHLVVTYESLIESPREAVMQILDYLRTPYATVFLDVQMQKLGHPATPGFVERLRIISTQQSLEPTLTTA